MNSWIPTADTQLDPFANNFQTLIGANPTNYSLVAADATAITAAYNSWHTAFQAATNPTTRTKATVATKNLQKTNVLSVLRRYGATIRTNVGVSDALKIGLGLHVRDVHPTPIPPPTTQPVLTMVNAGIGAQALRAADETTPNKRARPAGTVGMLLFCAVEPDAAPDPSTAQFLTFLTKADFTANFAPADNGKTATYFGRWTNQRGELGPWSGPLVQRIAA